MKNIFKHLDNIEISSIADNEASRSTTFFFKFHKIFCGKCREEFSNYKLLNLKISQSFKLINPRTRSEKLVYIYKLTSKVAVYLFIASLSLSSVGITYAQAQTDEDIIPEIKIFEDGEIISFSEEEIENLFTEVVDPIQATLITFFTTETITSESVTKEVEEQVNVLTTLIEQSKSVDQPGLAAEAIIVDVVIEAAEEVVEDAIEDVNQVVKDAEGIVDEEIVELKDLKNALKEIDENIKIAIAQNNSDALNGLQNTRENILKSIQEVEKEIETAKEKAGEEIEKAKEKAEK